MIFKFRRGLAEALPWSHKVPLWVAVQCFPHTDQVHLQCERQQEDEVHGEVVFHPRDGDHNHRLRQTDSQHLAIRGLDRTSWLKHDLHDLNMTCMTCTAYMTQNRSTWFNPDVSQVGGSMGLWLGLSVIQAIQILAKVTPQFKYLTKWI